MNNPGTPKTNGSSSRASPDLAWAFCRGFFLKSEAYDFLVETSRDEEIGLVDPIHAIVIDTWISENAEYAPYRDRLIAIVAPLLRNWDDQ